VSKEELGTVVFEVPKVRGADKPFKMPQLQEENHGEHENAD
jgi:hypothetical protein